MEKRMILAIVLSAVVLFGYQQVFRGKPVNTVESFPSGEETRPAQAGTGIDMAQEADIEKPDEKEELIKG